MSETPDEYDELAQELTAHGLPTTRERAKVLAHGMGWGAVLTATETFVVGLWWESGSYGWLTRGGTA